jgi:quinoprotein glucose dehydrogenase
MHSVHVSIPRSLGGLLLLGALSCNRAPATPPGDWGAYGSDKASTKYSAVDLITTANAPSLQTAWEWEGIDQPILDADTSLYTGNNESTPLAVNGVLYTSTSLSQAAAIDGATGKTLWTYNPQSYRDGTPPNLGYVHRGVAYWEEGKEKRILYGTGDAWLIALDATTGKPVATFGDSGRVDLTKGLRRPVSRALYGVSSPPVICGGKIVVGSSIVDGPGNEMPPGDVRGVDVRTGQTAWTFESIPQGEIAGGASWGDLSWMKWGNTNVWSYMSCDEARGIVYLPFTTPTNDYYGGQRPGDNKYAESIVAVNVATGDKLWDFQAVHHGLWDYDLPAAPILLDVTVAGARIPALAQVSKQGFVYVLDRLTGKPVWPIEERPVPQGPTIPGERLSATQPFPTKPAAFDRQGITVNELIDFTPTLRKEAEAIVGKFAYGPLFTPMAERPTLILPGIIGGASWAGAAADPVHGILYVPSLTLPTALVMAKSTDTASIHRYTGTFDLGVDGPRGLPLLKPPYGRVTAIDLNTGEQLWMKPSGKGPKDHPALAGLNLPDLGWPYRTFVLRTPSVLLAAQEGNWQLRGGSRRPAPGPSVSKRGNAILLQTQPVDPALRVMDPVNGNVIAEIPLPDNATGAPMTYLAGGAQYIAIPVGGANHKARLVALRLPPAGR